MSGSRAHREYGQLLGRGIGALRERGSMLRGEAEAAAVREAGELMTALSARMHEALPEQRAVAADLIKLAFADMRSIQSDNPETSTLSQFVNDLNGLTRTSNDNAASFLCYSQLNPAQGLGTPL